MIIWRLYYRKARRKEYLFTYYMIGIIVFFLCFTLKKMELDMGMALGLFAIFGILRYRTNQIEIREMTYLFVVIGSVGDQCPRQPQHELRRDHHRQCGHHGQPRCHRKNLVRAPGTEPS